MRSQHNPPIRVITASSAVGFIQSLYVDLLTFDEIIVHSFMSVAGCTITLGIFDHRSAS